MSRLAKQATYSNGPPTKHQATPAKEVASELLVLDMGRPGTQPDIQIEAGAAYEKVAQLSSENAELRSRLEQNEQLMHAAVASEEIWLERQKEYEVLLEEKSDVIRGLHQKIHELQEGSAGENFARADQLNQLKKELDDREKQLSEDEASLVSQMRAMEMALSRDRAELARQRNDVQRLQADIHREIEMASRDSGLRERLASLSRRNQEGNGRRSAPKTEICIELPPLPTPLPMPPAPPPPAPPPSPKKSRGFFSRLFGSW